MPLENASLNESNLPINISDISAKTIITPDLIKIERLTGQHSQGLVSISGWISPAEENKQLRYELSINAKQAQRNDDRAVNRHASDSRTHQADIEQEKKPENTSEGSDLEDSSSGSLPPKAVFKETSYNVGEVEQGQDIQHTFIVKNTGPGVLKIISVRPS